MYTVTCYSDPVTGFRLVIGSINHLQIVTTINSYTIIDFHTTKNSTLISSYYLR
jgi:hypothetical protein